MPFLPSGEAVQLNHNFRSVSNREGTAVTVLGLQTASSAAGEKLWINRDETRRLRVAAAPARQRRIYIKALDHPVTLTSEEPDSSSALLLQFEAIAGTAESTNALLSASRARP